MTTISKRDMMLTWAAASRKTRHGLRATCTVIEMDDKGRVICAHHHFL